MPCLVGSFGQCGRLGGKGLCLSGQAIHEIELDRQKTLAIDVVGSGRSGFLGSHVLAPVSDVRRNMSLETPPKRGGDPIIRPCRPLTVYTDRTARTGQRNQSLYDAQMSGIGCTPLQSSTTSV